MVVPKDKKTHKWNRRNKNKVSFDKRSGQYISDDEFKIIFESSPESIKSAIYLAYFYGLRRSETLAVSKQSLRKGYLFIEKQINSFDGHRGEYGPLKSRDVRKVPHWHRKSLDTVLKHIEAIELMHPSTLTERWSKLMKQVGLNYTFHSLRNTFISNAFRDGRNPSDIQFAAGHSDLRTTMGYQRDYRDLDDEVFAA